MKPVFQTTFGIGKGNCFAACVATLLGLKVPTNDQINYRLSPKEWELVLPDYVPNFCCDYGPGEWFDAFTAWLKPRGLAAISHEFPGGADGHLQWVRRCAPNIPWLANGPTPRGPHYCVYIGDKLWHDPNPHASPIGLQEVEGSIYLLAQDLTRIAKPSSEYNPWPRSM